MLLNCSLLLFFATIVNAYYDFGNCPYPKIKNGFGRLRQRGNLVKYSCRPRYTLMGNRYATCRGGQWDLPTPICIKSGCDYVPPVENSVTQMYHSDAWILFFCFPGYTLVGSPVIYCDGSTWNDTIPRCVGTSAPVPTSCDFEDAQLCGWKQDEIHDFDWLRLNRRTPSSYLLTGPQFDHTKGKKGGGYYMYIESTSRMTNDTARLLSPVFDSKLTKDGCFVFFYHMFGKGIGGLRVYQKVDSMTMDQLLKYNENGTNKYIIFEQWGNQGNTWFTGYSPLLDMSDDFQIVIEGIRGKNFLSDIAIDDVSIQQGENCSNMALYATTPIYVNEDSCTGRCGSLVPRLDGQCQCHINCIITDTCCADYLEICEFLDGISDVTKTRTTLSLPQTQKLVASTTDNTPNTTPYTVTPIALTTQPTKSTNKIIETTVSTTKENTKTSSNNLSTLVTTVKASITTSLTTKFTTPSVLNTKTTSKNITTEVSNKISTFNIQTTTPSPKTLKPDKTIADKNIQRKGRNSIVTVLIILMVLGVCCGVLFVSFKMRSAAGCVNLARWRGRVTSDPEVRFLNGENDVNIN